MIQFYVYIYKNPLKNMESFYVGKGFDNRSHVHLRSYNSHTKSNPHFHRTLQKMLREGNHPEIEVINVTCEFAALWFEKVLIKAFGRRDLGTGTLLNLTDGGEGMSGFLHTEETKQRIGASNKGKKRTKEQRENISKSLKGNTHTTLGMKFPNRKSKPQTEEHKKNRSLALLGVSKSESHKRNISIGMKKLYV